jgi:HD-GYP domain-containing protein (c-di-GMP phosphodiesterase class II)
MPDRILNKAEELTDQEWDRIRRHPVIGYKLFAEIPLLKETAKLILHHHERYDGRGYPEGLQGENIPFGSRLLAVADAYDYMTTGHAHREALSKSRAFAELFQNARTQFCPVAVKALSIGLQNQPR